MKQRIERGAVLKVDQNSIEIDENYTVYKDGIPVGTLQNNMTWFPSTEPPKPDEIKSIIYDHDYTWRMIPVKSIIEEFENSAEDVKEAILLDAYYNSRNI